jgi:2-dehydro-3-deoxyphosphogluconate aldolase / (4S)-4-hydroxy-2-oxoglutarate aldolase
VTPHDLRRSEVADLVRHHRLVVVLRRVQPMATLRSVVDDLAEAGARIFEITMDGVEAPAAIEALRRALPGRGAQRCAVGAGTVRSRAQLDAAIGAGAEFAVSPTMSADVLAESLARGVPFLPGCLTPTEIEVAWRHGATFVKVFPASSVGPTHVRELRGPLGEIELVPTGGIDATSAMAYLDAGAVAVGVGSALVAADPAARRALVAAVGTRP